jgi:hypothetical protein
MEPAAKGLLLATGITIGDAARLLLSMADQRVSIFDGFFCTGTRESIGIHTISRW